MAKRDNDVPEDDTATNGDGDGYGTDEGDTGKGQVNPDTTHTEDENNSGSVVAGRDDIPVDPGNSGMVGDNVYGDRVDQTGDGSGTEPAEGAER